MGKHKTHHKQAITTIVNRSHRVRRLLLRINRLFLKIEMERKS